MCVHEELGSISVNYWEIVTILIVPALCKCRHPVVAAVAPFCLLVPLFDRNLCPLLLRGIICDRLENWHNVQDGVNFLQIWRKIKIYGLFSRSPTTLSIFQLASGFYFVETSAIVLELQHNVQNGLVFGNLLRGQKLQRRSKFQRATHVCDSCVVPLQLHRRQVHCAHTRYDIMSVRHRQALARMGTRH